ESAATRIYALSLHDALPICVPLIGFSGSPWTLACYMVEGGGSDDYRLVKTLMYQRPDLMHRILAINADAVALYLNTQIEAGAQADRKSTRLNSSHVKISYAV